MARYIRLDPLDYTVKLGEPLVPIQVKNYLPESFLMMHRCAYVQPISIRDSFLHSLLYLLYPEYPGADWRVRTRMVEQARDSLTRRRRFYPETDDLTYISNVLQISITIVEDTGITTYGDGPSIYLYRDYMGVYSPIKMDVKH